MSASVSSSAEAPLRPVPGGPSGGARHAGRPTLEPRALPPGHPAGSTRTTPPWTPFRLPSGQPTNNRTVHPGPSSDAPTRHTSPNKSPDRWVPLEVPNRGQITMPRPLGLDHDAASTLHAGCHEHPSDNQSGPGAGDPRAGPGEVVQGAACAARRGLRRGAGQHLRPARLERGGQDHGGEDPVHAAQGRRRDSPGQRLRRRDTGRRRPRVHQSHRAVRGRRRDPHRAGEPRPGRPAAAPQGAGRDRG